MCFAAFLSGQAWARQSQAEQSWILVAFGFTVTFGRFPRLIPIFMKDIFYYQDWIFSKTWCIWYPDRKRNISKYSLHRIIFVASSSIKTICNYMLIKVINFTSWTAFSGYLYIWIIQDLQSCKNIYKCKYLRRNIHVKSDKFSRRKSKISSFIKLFKEHL